MALRLAIIEDNADLLDELLAWLGYRGFEVWGTRSAEAFWRQLHSHPVDIVLVDIGLPGEDGFSVLNYLHELGHYGLVVVSARGQQQDKLQALSLGADAYLIKPVNFAHLAETLTALGARLR
ncbi:response regulator, partial [Klebsiella pneumoniae]